MTQLCNESIAVLTVPEYHLDNPLGGAEAIADQLVQKLSLSYDVFVLHGYDQKRTRRHSGQRISSRIVAFDAFPITDAIRDNALIPAKYLSEQVINILCSCSAIIEFERVIIDIAPCKRFAVLGGTCYPHCRQLAQSYEWDYLIVPSDHVLDTAVNIWSIPKTKIKLIQNGLDLNNFKPELCSARTNKIYNLLLPSRPDIGKGYDKAITFALAANKAEHRVQLNVFQQVSLNHNHEFYNNLSSMAVGVDLVMRPWRPRSMMPHIYHEADITLCLGELPEGFGLTAVESVACGTPVLATPVGYLRDILPAKHGITWITDGDDIVKSANDLPNIIKKGRLDCTERGIPFIKQTYSEQKMMNRFIEVIREGARYV